MGTITDQINEAFRDYVTAGVASSGAQDVEKSEVREIGPLIEAAISSVGLGSLVSVTHLTKAAIDADLDHDADAVGLVHSDGTDANNDLYIKVGASGAGSWTLTTTLHDIIEGLAQPYVDLAQAWAEGTTPGGGSTKSAKEWSEESQANAGARHINKNLFDAPRSFSIPNALHSSNDATFNADGSLVTIPAGTSNTFYFSDGSYTPVVPGRLYYAEFRVSSGTLGSATLQFSGESAVDFIQLGSLYYVSTVVPVGITTGPTLIVTNGDAGVDLVLEEPEYAMGDDGGNGAIIAREQWALDNYQLNQKKAHKSNLYTSSRTFDVPADDSSEKLRNSDLRIAHDVDNLFMLDLVDQSTGEPAMADRIWMIFHDGTGGSGVLYMQRLKRQPGTYFLLLPADTLAATSTYGEVNIDNLPNLSSYTAAAVRVENIQCYAVEFPSFVPDVVTAGAGAFNPNELLVAQNTGDEGDETRVFVHGKNPTNDIGHAYLFQPLRGVLLGSATGTLMRRVYEAERKAQGLIELGPQITDQGQDDFAIYVKESVNNFSGGYHDYEYETADPLIWIDGEAVTYSDAANYSCGTYQRKDESELMLYGTATKFADREITHMIDGRDGTRTVHNKVTFTRQTVLGPAYLYMKTLSRWRGHIQAQGTNFDEVYYPDIPDEMRQTSGSLVDDTYRAARKIVFDGPIGAGLSVEAEVLRGDTVSAWTQFGTNTIKWYVSSSPVANGSESPSPTALTAEIGDVLELVTREKITNRRSSIAV